MDEQGSIDGATAAAADVASTFLGAGQCGCCWRALPLEVGNCLIFNVFDIHNEDLSNAGEAFQIFIAFSPHQQIEPNPRAEKHRRGGAGGIWRGNDEPRTGNNNA